MGIGAIGQEKEDYDNHFDEGNDDEEDKVEEE